VGSKHLKKKKFSRGPPDVGGFFHEGNGRGEKKSSKRLGAPVFHAEHRGFCRICGFPLKLLEFILPEKGRGRAGKRWGEKKVKPGIGGFKPSPGTTLTGRAQKKTTPQEKTPRREDNHFLETPRGKRKDEQLWGAFPHVWRAP